MPALQPQAPDLLEGKDEDDEIQSEAGPDSTEVEILQIDAAVVGRTDGFGVERVWYVSTLEDVCEAYRDSPDEAEHDQHRGDATEGFDVKDTSIE